MTMHGKARHMTRGLYWAVLAAALLGVVAQVEAASLKVSPARFIVHDVHPGVQYDIYKETGLRITVFNDDDTERAWLLSVHRPSERGTWERGYAEIPDASWCWFDRSEVTVPPKGIAYAHLFLRVPEEEKFLNQRWVVTLGVDGKPGAGGIALAADIRVQIETKSAADVKQEPDGPLGTVPSILQLEGMTPGALEKKSVTLYNNDTKAHSYTITPLFSDPAIEQSVYLTHSFETLPDPKWITFPEKISIAPGHTGTLDLEVWVPNGAAHSGKKWESVLLIQPDEGRAGFVRVRSIMKETEKTE